VREEVKRTVKKEEDMVYLSDELEESEGEGTERQVTREKPGNA
jgi:hypothetical protein